MVKRNTNDMKQIAEKNDLESIEASFVHILEEVIAKDRFTATDSDIFKTLAYLVRGKLMRHWINTQNRYHSKNVKRVYFLSMEYLIGRLLNDTISNLGIHDVIKELLSSMRFEFDRVLAEEHDGALGNGGLGRLAACFMDSMATLAIPSHGYGMRYNYGNFKQEIVDGEQFEIPDNWLKNGNPWDVERNQYSVRVKFYGNTEKYISSSGDYKTRWVDSRDVIATPYDTPVPGYGNEVVNSLRLWQSAAIAEYSPEAYKHQDYFKACEDVIFAENLSKILYPNDDISAGRELRMMQHYFFASASIQDIVRRFKVHNHDFKKFPEKAVIQLNDTHPAFSIPEFVRILVDTEGLSFDEAWNTTKKVFSYTNHTLSPDSMDRWPADAVRQIIPRIFEIIQLIDQKMADEIGDPKIASKVSIINKGKTDMVCMGHLALSGCFSVNGISEQQTELLKKHVFKEFFKLYPERFNNKTNGITPRKWLLISNHKLAELIRKSIGNKFLTNLTELTNLLPLADNKEFRDSWYNVKQYNKKRLAAYVLKELGVTLNIESLFDTQAKRVGAHKRQTLTVLHAIHLYNRIKKNPDGDFQPRSIIIAGKASPGNDFAKQTIRLINNVADVINNDPVCENKLNLIFLANYNVSLATLIIPASDLSEQISTPGLEPSGTGNMKFALNGAVTIGSLCGSNLEILEEVGEDNFITFGHTKKELDELKATGFNPNHLYKTNKDVEEILDMIKNGYFSPDDKKRFVPFVKKLLDKDDRCMNLADFESYIAAQKRVDELYRNRDEWIKTSIRTTASTGKFSSDRTINEYATEIWKIKKAGRK